MTLVFLLFFLSASALWALTAGYGAVLVLLARGRRRPLRPVTDWPAITVVIATLDEQRWIQDKLENIARGRYPPGRITVLVVDGGSTDATVQQARAFSTGGLTVRVLQAPAGAGKAAQLSYAMPYVKTQVVVCTDADTALDEHCMTRLVAALLEDPCLEVAGARIEPVTNLPEEGLHWALLNRIWWLEGEAFGAAGVSGACYAARARSLRREFRSVAEDVEVAQVHAFQSGGETRIVWRAVASEMRVPQSLDQWLAYRRFRGGHYRQVVLRERAPDDERRRTVVQRVRKAQFLALPYLAAVSLASGATLAAGGQWPVLIATIGVFIVSALPLFSLAARRYGVVRGPWLLIRWLVLTLYVLLVLNHRTPPATSLAGVARQSE